MTHDSGQPDKDILVVDDDAILRDLVADWLESAGYGVRKAASCVGAVDELRRKAPALVISDMYMPGPCGGAAIAKLKSQLPGVALIALSGYFNSGQGLTREAALAAGAARALAKPIKRNELLQAVAELIGAPVR